MELAYITIGRAILAAQTLEVALAPIYEMYRLHTEPGRIEKTDGRLPIGAFKVPIANIVKTLAANGSIDPDFEARLVAYNEARHLLVHRWVQEYGIADPSDARYFLKLAQHALHVEQEARELTRVIVGYMVKYAEPEWAKANSQEFKAKMQGIFLNATNELGAPSGHT
jgi:hypothetical protein